MLEAEVDPDPQIEPRVWLELARALGKRPYERHATAAALAEDLLRAVGETDATLASSLRRAPPSRSEFDAPEEQAPASPSTIEGQSVEGHFVLRRPAWMPWALGASAAVVAAGLTFLLLPSSQRQQAPGASTVSRAATSEPSAAQVPVEQPSATASAPISPQAAAATESATTAPARPPPRSAPHPARPKPIGTTPGF